MKVISTRQADVSEWPGHSLRLTVLCTHMHGLAGVEFIHLVRVICPGMHRDGLHNWFINTGTL